MANRSVIDIDVNDQQFKAFYELYKDFHDKLEDMPESWKTINAEAGKVQEAIAAGLGDIVGHLGGVSNGLQDLNKHLRDSKALQKQFGELTGTSESAMKKLAHASKELKDNLFSVGGFVMKLGAAGLGIFTGAAFGLDKLAQSAVGTQRTARGLGLTPGQLQAFHTDFGLRYMDDSTLGGIADKQQDMVGQIFQRRALGGITADQLQGMNAGTLAGKLALAAHDWWEKTPAAQRNAQFYQASFLDRAGIPFDQARQYGNTDRGELTQALKQYGQDQSRLNVGNGQIDALYSFERQLKLAGTDLETYLSRKLAALGPHLGGFITMLETDGKKLLDEVLTPKNLDRVGKGLDDIASYLGSQDFLTTMKEAGHDISAFLSALGGAAAWIAKYFPSLSPNAMSSDPLPGETDAQGNVKPGNASFLGRLGWELLGSDTAGKWAAEKAAAIHGGTSPLDARQKGSLFDHLYGWYGRLNGFDPYTGKPVVPFNKADAATLFASLEKGRGLPPGTLMAVAQKESSFNPLAHSSKGAAGLFQLMPDTAKEYGVTDPYDWQQEAIAAAKKLKHLVAYYKGDYPKALAAWNWGEGNLDADIKKHGDAWASYLPDETKGFLSGVKDRVDSNGQEYADAVKYLRSAGVTGDADGGGIKQQAKAAKAAYAPKPAQPAATDAQPTTPTLSNAQAMLLRPRNPNVNIRIFNEAGANVAVSTNAASVA